MSTRPPHLKRPKNVELRSREYLLPDEVEKLLKVDLIFICLFSCYLSSLGSSFVGHPQHTAQGIVMVNKVVFKGSHGMQHNQRD